MINSKSSLCITTALAGGVLAALLTPAAAEVGCGEIRTVITLGLVGSPLGSSVSNTLPNFGLGFASALGSVVTTSDVALMAQGSSAFVAGSATSAPDLQGGGVWARAVGGSFLASVPTTGVTNIPIIPASVPVDCQSRVRQEFDGVQVGADVANFNLGASGGTLHIGLTSGVIETSAVANSFINTKFQVPFFGLYSALSFGDLFADAQIRGNFYEGQVTDVSTPVSQKFTARGFTLSGNIGYNYKLWQDWFIEPSAGINWSRAFPESVGFSTIGNSTFVIGGVSFPGPAFSIRSNLRIADFDDIIGRASVRVGTTYIHGPLVLQPFVTATVLHEFARPISSNLDTVLGSSDLVTTSLSTSRIGTFGQFGLGVAGQIANIGLTGFVRGDYRTGSRFEGWSVAGGARYQYDPEKGTVVQGRSAEVAGAPYLPAPYNWTGFFIGAAAPGALWGEGKWSFAGAGGTAANNYSGVLAGGGGGYNYQMGPYVIGGQVEWDWTNARGGESFSCPTIGGVFFNNCDTRVTSIFTATARAGYAYDRLLVYGQAGLAVGDIVAKTVVPGNPSFSASKTSVGWTAGGGFEFGLTQNISAKAEYLYFDLGSDTYNLGAPVAIHRNGNIGRVGLNYRFDLM